MDQPKQPGFFRRNLIWIIPVFLLVPCLCCGGGVAGMFSIVFGALKNNDAYRHAVAEAKANAEVVEALGEPITEGYFVGGNLNVSGSSGDADLTIPISGPKGSATIYLKATMFANQWEYSNLEVAIDGTGERIDLLADE